VFSRVVTWTETCPKSRPQPIARWRSLRGFFDKYQIRFQRYKDEIELWRKSTSV
jgi:hypothetical protein